MGSPTITYAVAALAIAIVCLLLGFFWGRSNAKSKVEAAVEKEHVSLDAREFAIRQQLDEAMAELARLRPLAEKRGRLDDQYEQKGEAGSVLGIGPAAPGKQESPGEEPVTSSTGPADATIQKLLHSLDVTLDQPEERASIDEPQEMEIDTPPAAEKEPPVPQPVEKEPGPFHPVEQKPIQPQQAEQKPIQPQPAEQKPIQPQPAETKPAPPHPAQTRPPADDEWQEFARSLAALTGRKK